MQNASRKGNSMKRKKIKCGVELTRIGSKHAWYFAGKDENNVVHIVMFSYDTPIFSVSNIGNTPNTNLHVILNKDAYKYSRTTSKQISQWITEIHMFTQHGCYLPWSFKNVIETCEKNDVSECVIDSVEYDVVPESVLVNLCYLISAAKLTECNLRDF